jgi:predicted RND superfamily exporter protein
MLARYPRSAVVASLVLTAFAVVGLVRFAREPIDYDFRHLGSRAGLKDGAAFWDGHVDAVLQSYQTPTVVMTESTQKAQTVAYALESARENPASLGDVPGLSEEARKSAAETIDSVSTLQKLVPDHQQRKIDLLQEIFRLVAPPPGIPGLIDPRVLKALPEDLRPTLLRLREKTKLVQVSLADVPRRLVQPFVERDGHRGRLVLVYPTLETDSKHGRAQILHAKLVRGVASKVDPGSLVAGQIVLTSDIIDAITGDGGFAALLSFVAVAVLTVVIMRSLRDASWVLGSLCLGVLGMFGALGALSLRLNFVNFAVLPITFGIGVDYAVNFYQRYRQSECVEDAVAAAGGAVTLCSATTIIGYATLVTADNMAIQSFGLTAVIGELTCLSAALFALPALLAFGDRQRTDRAPAAPRVAPTPAPVLPAEPRREAPGL